jgi:hypothetical protein
MSEECETLGAGTIYSQDPQSLLDGLPTQASYERDLSRKWLLVDKTDYSKKGYFAGRQAGLQTAVCPRRRFVATAIVPPEPAQEGDQVREDRLVTAELYSGSLNSE